MDAYKAFVATFGLPEPLQVETVENILAIGEVGCTSVADHIAHS